MRFEHSWHGKPNNEPLPKRYGIAYEDFSRAIDIYYPIPLNYVVKYYRLYCRLLIKALYWVGLIDIGIGEMFHWGAFYRIKLH